MKKHMKKRIRFDDGGVAAAPADAEVATTMAAPADAKAGKLADRDARDATKNAQRAAIDQYKDQIRGLERAKGTYKDKAVRENYKNYLRSLPNKGEIKRGIKSGAMTQAPTLAAFNPETTYSAPERAARAARANQVARAVAAANPEARAANMAKRAALLSDIRRRLPGGTTPMKKGGSVGSASSRGDGIAARGKTRGKIV